MFNLRKHERKLVGSAMSGWVADQVQDLKGDLEALKAKRQERANKGGVSL